MHNSILMTFLAGALSTGIIAAQENKGAATSSVTAPAATSKKLTRAEFDGLLANPSQVLIIDVRRPDEHTANGGFPAFLSIQLADLDKYADFIPRDRALITVSNHAARGLKAADLLANKGFKVAGSIGVQDYEAEGGTIARFQPPQRAAAPKE